MTPELKKLGAQIREIRQKAGFSQEELAERTGLHRTYIGSVERGERNIGVINLIRIARALKTSPGQLLAKF
jgi:transcriptional regulator with XRE-family HTH domain